MTGGCVSVWERSGPAKPPSVTTQTYCIAQYEAHNCIYILTITTHHPQHYSYTYEEQLNTNIYILDGRFCEKYSVRLSLSHYQILGSNVSPSSAICAGLSLLIVFAGGVGSVWRVEVVEVSTQTNDEDLKITVNIIATGYDEDNDSIV